MRVVFFYHSLVSDWNHGNAHFLRGVVSELKSQGHEAVVYEPRCGWSLKNLMEQHGRLPLYEFKEVYPQLYSVCYELEDLDLEEALDGADIVLVHEWNDPELVRRIGLHRKTHSSYRLFFHDTHHRMVSESDAMARYDLQHFDAILAFGKVLQERYQDLGFRNVYLWHEAADVRIFKPFPDEEKIGDVVWIGNGGDGKRSEELRKFILNPVENLRLNARLYGVRYSQEQLEEVAKSGIEYWGWLANFKVPQVYSLFSLALHIPQKLYVDKLPGIPTIRVFEALASGIPLVTAPWSDAENLFTEERDYVVARNGDEMEGLLKELLANPAYMTSLARHGRDTILAKHTCRHRVNELLNLFQHLNLKAKQPVLSSSSSEGRSIADAGI